MKLGTKVALGVSAGLIGMLGFLTLRPTPSVATDTIKLSSIPITAPVTIDPIPSGMATPPVSAQSALDTAHNMTGAMMAHATAVEVQLATVGTLQQSGIALPGNFSGPSSGELWIVTIKGLNMPPAGPVGSSVNYPPHHQLNAVINALTGSPVEMYSDN
ncbi:MAG: hypothetical protein M0Z66_02880 [Thermaerobacter sp.]|nr:hypothetical protein [Thermaerobacter sp.]